MRLQISIHSSRFGIALIASAAALAASPALSQDGGYRPQGFGYDNAYQADNYSEHFALVCYGEGHRLSSQPDTGYEWNSDRRRYEPRDGYTIGREDYDTSVTIEIDGAQGRIRPASDMVPLLHGGDNNGWYDLTNLAVSRDFIRGQFRFSGLNKPSFTIDRRAGHIQIEGLTPFSGSCQPLDGDRRF